MTAANLVTDSAIAEEMAYLNENYLKLQAGYLFPEVARRVREFCEANPEATQTIDSLRNRRCDGAAATRGDRRDEARGR